MVNTVLDQIFSDLERLGISSKEAASRAGIRAQSLSRIRKRGNTDLETVSRLAAVVGAKITLAPADPLAEKILNGTLFHRAKK